jgi:RecB family exonuclease
VQKTARKPLAREQMGVSSTEFLHFHPYKTTAVHKVYDTNLEEGVNFVEYKLV